MERPTLAGMPSSSSDLNVAHRAGRLILAWIIRILGVLALVMLLLALTPLPRLVYDWLGHVPEAFSGSPDYIVLMGGGGIPSESGLMRCYETAAQADRHPRARVLVAMPREPDEPEGQPGAVARELMFRGVDRSRIVQEGRGRHTREQAVNAWALVGGPGKDPALLVVSSPDHVRRSVLAFRRAGFARVAGAGAFGQDLQADLRLPDEPGSTLPNPAHSILLRYRLWENLGMELDVFRELTALLYYRVRGWI